MLTFLSISLAALLALAAMLGVLLLGARENADKCREERDGAETQRAEWYRVAVDNGRLLQETKERIHAAEAKLAAVREAIGKDGGA